MSGPEDQDYRYGGQMAEATPGFLGKAWDTVTDTYASAREHAPKFTSWATWGFGALTIFSLTKKFAGGII